MKSPAHTLALLIAVAFVWSVVHLFGVEFATGSVYPEYSSLRSDPQGVKLLYESLAGMTDIRVSRNYLPLESLGGEGQTVILLGMEPGDVAAQSDVLKRIAGRGNRVVAALAAENAKPEILLRSWNVPLEIEAEGRQPHGVSFGEAEGWTAIERFGNRSLAIERGWGKGSVVLLAQSHDFTNGSTVAADRLDLVARALGDHRRIVFDESHLGIAESGSVVSLARRMRLSGLAMGLAICAALWIWRASSAFPPPCAAVRTSSLAGRTSHAGLLTLLRRNIPPRDLAGVCLQEWLSFNRNKLSRERAVLAAAAASQSRGPVEAAREIQKAIHAKGQL